MPEVSIITVNYNNAAGLKKTMESVLVQDFGDYEYIIIDGGSNDDSLAIINKFSPASFHWISEPDKGPYDAMNKGLQKAGGDYIQFLNSGDHFISGGTLKKCFEGQQHHADILYGQINAYWGSEMRTIGYPDSLTLSFLKQYNINHQSCFCKRGLLTELNGFDLDYTLAADYALLLRCAMKGASFHYLPFPVVEYDMQGMSTGRMPEYIAQMEQAWKDIIPSSINNNLVELQQLKKNAGKPQGWLKKIFSNKPVTSKDSIHHFPERFLDY